MTLSRHADVVVIAWERPRGFCSPRLEIPSRLHDDDERLQFEITAIFALADIHGMDLDKDQAHALV
jgi:hypothetical protein